jgi:excinuclease ABC subunit B
MFDITSNLVPKADQIPAIEKLVQNIKNNVKQQVLLGATGTGKTFTIANVVAQTKLKTLVLVHNKTLASQLYSEFKELFQNDNVEYYVSYFDFYQPEAYKPATDTYIEKKAISNQEIEMLRLSTINSLSSSKNTIVIASVAAIYASVSPIDFEDFKIVLKTNTDRNLKQLIYELVRLGYSRNENSNLEVGEFRNKGDVLEIALGHADTYTIRISFFGSEIEDIAKIDKLNNNILEH